MQQIIREGRRLKALAFLCFAVASREAQGRLNIMDAVSWNKAAISGIIFKLLTQNSIEASWEKEDHFSNVCFWTTKIPNDASWVWRNTLKHRKRQAKSLFVP